MEDLSTVSTFPHFHNFTASSNTTQITLPTNCNAISIGSDAKALYVARNGASDGGTVPTNKAFIPKSNYLVINLGRGFNRDGNLYVACQSGSGEISIILEGV